jgi:hypothetical protein
MEEQWRLIQRVGLLNTMNLTAVFVSANASRLHMPSFEDPRVAVHYAGLPELFEYPTLQLLHAHCKEVSSSGGHPSL